MMHSGLDFWNLRDGNRVLVFYLPETDDFEPGGKWYERRFLCRVTENIWVVLPRDPDYVRGDSAEADDVQPFGPSSGFIGELPRNQLVYTFPPGRWDSLLVEFMAEGRRLAGRKVRVPETMELSLKTHAKAYQDQPEKDHYYWWPSIMRLSAWGAGADEMLFLAELSEAAMSYDQLDTSELLCFDTFCRRYQRWPEMYWTQPAPAEFGWEHEDWLDERHVFFGQARVRWAALICPELESYVTKELEEQSAILKEQRKAREEQAVAHLNCPPEQPQGSEGPSGSGGSGSAGGHGDGQRGRTSRRGWTGPAPQRSPSTRSTRTLRRSS